MSNQELIADARQLTASGFGLCRSQAIDLLDALEASEAKLKAAEDENTTLSTLIKPDWIAYHKQMLDRIRKGNDKLLEVEARFAALQAAADKMAESFDTLLNSINTASGYGAPKRIHFRHARHTLTAYQQVRGE